MKLRSFKLTTTPFEAIKSGHKIIESRLYDEIGVIGIEILIKN